MIEAPIGLNLWNPIHRPDAIVITTNGYVTSTGRAVMGRGCALEAAHRIADLEVHFGRMLRRNGNHVMVLVEEYNALGRAALGLCSIVSFPVKHHWRWDADLELIDRSVGELLELANERDWRTVVMPRPGCGNGRLKWAQVRSLLVDRLDDRFTIVVL